MLVFFWRVIYTHLAGLSIKLPSCKASTNLWRPPPVRDFLRQKTPGGNPKIGGWETTYCGNKPFLGFWKGLRFPFPWWNVGTFLETNFRWIHPSCMGPKIGLGGLEHLDEIRKTWNLCLVLQSLIWVFLLLNQKPTSFVWERLKLFGKKNWFSESWEGKRITGAPYKWCLKKMSVPCQLTENHQPLHPNYHPLGPII